jgi:hypothetical protein
VRSYLDERASLTLPPSARQLELADWVEFLEENAHFVHLQARFGGGGPRWEMASWPNAAPVAGRGRGCNLLLELILG